MHQRRLPRAGRAHDGGESSPLEVDRHPVQRSNLGIATAVDLDGVDRASHDGPGGGRTGGDWAGHESSQLSVRIRRPYATQRGEEHLQPLRFPRIPPVCFRHDVSGLRRRGGRRGAVLFVLRARDAPCWGRTAGGNRAVRRSCRLHDPVGDARSGTRQESRRPVLRASGRRHHVVRRAGRQDHRRRDRGPLRSAGGPRGRRGAGSARCPAHAGDDRHVRRRGRRARGAHAHRGEHGRGAGRRVAGRRVDDGDGRRRQHGEPASDHGRPRRGAGRPGHVCIHAGRHRVRVTWPDPGEGPGGTGPGLGRTRGDPASGPSASAGRRAAGRAGP